MLEVVSFIGKMGNYDLIDLFIVGSIEFVFDLYVNVYRFFQKGCLVQVGCCFYYECGIGYK